MRSARGTALILAGLALQPLASRAEPAAPAKAIAAEPLAAARAAAEAIDSSGRPAEAEAAWRRVIALNAQRRKPDPEIGVVALNRIGDTLYYRGRPDLALKELERARDLLRAAGLDRTDLMAETLANLGNMHTAMGHSEVDIPIQREALALRIALHGPDDPRAAINYYNLGYALYERGIPEEAADNIERGARMRIATMDPANPDLFLTLGTAAGIIEASGRVTTAIEFAQRAVELVNRYHPDHPYAGFARGVLGKALVAAGRASEAAEVTRQALDELVRTMGEDNPLTLDAMANLAVSLARLGRFDEAQELTLRSIPKRRETAAPDTVRSLVSASYYAAEAGREDQALAIAEDGYAFAAKALPADHAMRGMIAFTLAMHLERRGEDARALTLMREASAVYAKREDPGAPRLLASEIYLGGLEIEGGMREQGYARVRRAAEAMVPRMFSVAEDPELGALSNSYYESYARAAEAAVQMGRPADAFRYYQLAAYNLNVMASQQVALRSAAGRDTGAAARVRELQDASRSLRAFNMQKAALLTSGKAGQVADIDREIADTQQTIDRLRTKLAEEVPGYDRFSRPEIVPLDVLQARLAPGEGVYLALPSRTRTTLMAITRDKVRVATSAKPRSAMRPLVGAVRASVDRALNAGGEAPFDLAGSHVLYETLFPPAIREVTRGVRKLHVAATDALAELPFALLVTKPARGTGEAALRDAYWLIRDMSLDVPVTMASIEAKPAIRSEPAAFAGIGAPRLQGKPGAPIRLAGLYRGGEPDLEAIRDLPPLPHAAEELGEMGAAFAGHTLLLTGDQASEARVKTADLSRYSVLAFATHGLIAGEVDGLREPALVLTPPAKREGDDDGMLTATEIGGLRLDADWVVLSACNTAAGSTQYAPSYTGLAHAFIYAGARSLLLSHWRVRDDAASRLSVATVKGAAAGLDRAEALRRAILALIRDRKVPGGANPAVWAPFILIGE